MRGGVRHKIGRIARTLAALCLLILLPVHGFAAEPVQKPVHHKHANQYASSTQPLNETLGNQIQANWRINANLPDADKVHVRARLKLDPSGNLRGDPKVTAIGGSEETRNALISSVTRSIFRSVPLKGLPRDRYNEWREIVLNFDAAL
jgi:hypothetical protein